METTDRWCLVGLAGAGCSIPCLFPNPDGLRQQNSATTVRNRYPIAK